MTAEQVVGKLEKDTSAVAIAEHLLAGVRPQELERLLLRTIPERHAEIEDPFDDLDAALQRTFDIAYQKADRVLRARIARDYDRRLREDSQPVIEHYDLNFFRMDFLDHLDDAVATMVRQHLIGVLPGLSTYNRISSLGARVHPTEVDTFVDALVRKATFPREPRKRTQAEKYLNDELAGMPDKLLTLAVRRLQAWKRMFEKKDQTAYENVMRRALGEEEKFDPDADDALPF